MNDARKALIEAQDDLRDAKQPEPANGPSPEDARLLDESGPPGRSAARG